MKYIKLNSAINLIFISFFILSSTISAQGEQTIEVKEAYKFVGETKVETQKNELLNCLQIGTGQFRYVTK